jgi:hypothetical protein
LTTVRRQVIYPGRDTHPDKRLHHLTEYCIATVYAYTIRETNIRPISEAIDGFRGTGNVHWFRRFRVEVIAASWTTILASDDIFFCGILYVANTRIIVR